VSLEKCSFNKNFAYVFVVVLVDMNLCSEDQEDTVLIDCSNELASSVFINFNKLRCTGQLCDITLEIDECKFHAHRVVLAATIPFVRF